MENFGVVSELNWNFPDESEFTLAQLLGSFPEMHEQDQETSLGINSMFWSEFDQGASSYNTFENIPSCWPSSSNTASASSYFFSPTECESYELNTPNTNYNPVNYQIEGFIYLKDDQNEVKENSINNPSDGDALPDHKAKRKFPEQCVEDKDDGIPSESPKKKARGSSQVLNKSTRSKKGQKNGGNSEETLSNANSSSEDELNASQELNEGSIGKGKGRAGRGSATDPQSLYARKRRERINERLRILQNLVPNGTKVDISTMLDEAVQYVKFLQLQIKLLSSDDLWMYAPLAYNGMDIGLDLKLSFPKP